jgi:arginine repressor
VGSVAGDDTILLVASDDEAAQALALELKDGFTKK